MTRRFTRHVPHPPKTAPKGPAEKAARPVPRAALDRAAEQQAGAPAAPANKDDRRPKEIGGPEGPEPTRYGDWERKGICVDF